MAVLIVLSVLLLTGAGVYITHRFGDLTARQYDTHTMMYVEDPDPLQTTLTPEYRFYNAMRDIAERLHIKA